METSITIAGRRVGPASRPYVVAELSANHNGSLDRALRILEEAQRAGADAVKLQTYTADTLTIDCDSPEFQIEGGLWDGRTLYDLYDQAHTPWQWHEPLFARGRELGITVFSTPFDRTAVELLESLEAPAYKIASFEAVDLDLVECVAATGKPLIISTGMASAEEIERSVASARRAGCDQLALLHCVSGYPTPPDEANLRTLVDLAERFHTVVGLSDHTLGTAVALGAIALGAAIVEKHFTLRRADGGPDAAFSLEPEELQALCDGARSVHAALGRVSYERAPSEQSNALFRRSLYAVRDIAAGEKFSSDNVRSIRPGYGLPPHLLRRVVGQCAARAIARGTALSAEMVEGSLE